MPRNPPPDTSFYQWVHVFLILQALLLLLPSRLWTSLEGGRIASLCLAEVPDPCLRPPTSCLPVLKPLLLPYCVFSFAYSPAFRFGKTTRTSTVGE